MNALQTYLLDDTNESLYVIGTYGYVALFMYSFLGTAVRLGCDELIFTADNLNYMNHKSIADQTSFPMSGMSFKHAEALDFIIEHDPIIKKHIVLKTRNSWEIIYQIVQDEEEI